MQGGVWKFPRGIEIFVESKHLLLLWVFKFCFEKMVCSFFTGKKGAVFRHIALKAQSSTLQWMFVGGQDQDCLECKCGFTCLGLGFMFLVFPGFLFNTVMFDALQKKILANPWDALQPRCGTMRLDCHREYRNPPETSKHPGRMGRSTCCIYFDTRFFPKVL